MKLITQAQIEAPEIESQHRGRRGGILEGTATAFIGEATFEVGPGDFMGFPSPSPGHGLKNTSNRDLLYLVGGESNPADVVHYPWIQRTMMKSHGRRRWVDWQDLHDV